MGQHKNAKYREARKARRQHWDISLHANSHHFTVDFRDGSTVEIDDPAMRECIPVYLSVLNGKPWPQVEGSYNPPLILKNPLQSAFFDVFIRMTPEGHAIWEKWPFPIQLEMNYHLRACLCLIASIGYGEVLQTYAEPLHIGLITIPEVMERLDSQRMAIRSGAQGDGWFVKRWNLLKIQADIKSPV